MRPSCTYSMRLVCLLCLGYSRLCLSRSPPNQYHTRYHTPLHRWYGRSRCRRLPRSHIQHRNLQCLVACTGSRQPHPLHRIHPVYSRMTRTWTTHSRLHMFLNNKCCSIRRRLLAILILRISCNHIVCCRRHLYSRASVGLR